MSTLGSSHQYRDGNIVLICINTSNANSNQHWKGGNHARLTSYVTHTTTETRISCWDYHLGPWCPCGMNLLRINLPATWSSYNDYRDIGDYIYYDVKTHKLLLACQVIDIVEDSVLCPCVVRHTYPWLLLSTTHSLQ